MTNDLTATNRYQIWFDSGASTGRTIEGTTENTFYDYSTNKPKIENSSTATHTINFPIKLGYSGGLEINPVNGDLAIGGTINTDGKNIIVYGGNNKTLTLSGIVSGSGGLEIRPDGAAYPYVKLSGGSTYSGTTKITGGELWMDAGATINGSSAGAVEVGNSSYQSALAKMYIIDGDGGTTVNENLTIKAGGYGYRVVGATNSSGTNTYSGTVALEGSVALDQTNANGTVEFSGAISGSHAVYKTGPGTVKLSSTSNSYSGETNLNAGTLVVNGDQSAANGNVTVASGATLAGTGTVGGNTTITGTYAPGAVGAVGTQNFNTKSH